MKEETESTNQYGESELAVAEDFMYRDKPLTPKMIASLMHVEANLVSTFAHERHEDKKVTSSFGYIVGVVFASLVIASVIGGTFLYIHEISPFYEAVEAARSELQ